MSERRLTIDGVEIHDGGACYVIAEIGQQPPGRPQQAKELIDAAKDCGVGRGQAAEARQSLALHPRVLRAALRQRVRASDARTESIARRSSSRPDELPRAAGARTRASAITFFATAFDFESADFLAELDVPAFKFASGDIAQHTVASSRRRVREADGPLHGRCRPRGRRACGRGDPPAQRAALHPAMHGRVPGRHGRPEPQCDHDAPRAVPGARDRAVRPPERHCHGGRRLHARRARDREALHAQPRGKGHRSRVLADAGGNAKARARPAARAGRSRRRRQAAARRSRRRRSAKMGKKLVAARDLERRARSRPRKTSRSSRRPTAVFPRTSSTGSSGTRLRRRLAPDENVELADLEPVEEPVAAHAAPRR